MDIAWYTLDRTETELWHHYDEKLRLKYRSLLFASALHRVRTRQPDVRTIYIFDAYETPVARRQTHAANPPGAPGVETG